MRQLPVLAALLVAAPSALAQASQLQLPKVSPHARVLQTIGTTEISIDYHRPAVRGRTIWGELVPYGQGSYDQTKDVVRFEVRPEAAPMREFMAFTIDPLDAQTAEVRLAWEKLAIAFEDGVDVHGPTLAAIREAIGKADGKDWRIFYGAARYCYDNGIEQEQALAWADTSVGIQENSWNLETLALLLHRNGKVADAIAPLERALELARENGAPPEFIARTEAALGAWKKQM
jgi:tetratricopeptide (TPR) repeat protein